MSPLHQNPRIEIPAETRRMAWRLLEANLNRRLIKHGDASFAGKHEGLGTIAEEYHELVEAVRSNQPGAVVSEAIDVAVGCLWLAATLLEKHPDCKLAFQEVVEAPLDSKNTERRSE